MSDFVSRSTLKLVNVTVNLKRQLVERTYTLSFVGWIIVTEKPLPQKW